MQCEDGRQPMLMFMEKPSKKLYPDYYQVIAEPIDMLAIEANIKAEKYQSENELIQDFKVHSIVISAFVKYSIFYRSVLPPCFS